MAKKALERVTATPRQQQHPEAAIPTPTIMAAPAVGGTGTVKAATLPTPQVAVRANARFNLLAAAMTKTTAAASSTHSVPTFHAAVEVLLMAAPANPRHLVVVLVRLETVEASEAKRRASTAQLTSLLPFALQRRWHPSPLDGPCKRRMRH